MSLRIHIKHMVCPRCITAVKSIFNDLNINVLEITLGEVHIENPLSENLKDTLVVKLDQVGFQLLETKETQIIEDIKHLIIKQIHHQNELDEKVVFSTMLSNKLHKEYSVLSKLFSSVEGITIERFIVKQKIERVKALLFYNQFSLSQIALQLNYSSISHLSSQFKRETGMTPSAFKKLRKPGHKSLDF